MTEKDGKKKRVILSTIAGERQLILVWHKTVGRMGLMRVLCAHLLWRATSGTSGVIHCSLGCRQVPHTCCRVLGRTCRQSCFVSCGTRGIWCWRGAVRVRVTELVEPVLVL